MKINNFVALIALALCMQYMIASDFGHARGPKPTRKKARAIREVREALERENKKKKALLQQCEQDASRPSRPRRPARGPL